MAEALRSGQLDAAALDVFEQEPYPPDLLIQCDNAILTSHVGSLAREARQRMELEAAENLLHALIKAGVAKDEHVNAMSDGTAMETAIVYGASGFLGSHVSDALSAAGYRVRLFDRPSISLSAPRSGDDRW